MQLEGGAQSFRRRGEKIHSSRLATKKSISITLLAIGCWLSKCSAFTGSATVGSYRRLFISRSKIPISQRQWDQLQSPLKAAALSLDDKDGNTDDNDDDDDGPWKRTKNLCLQSISISLPALIGMMVDPLLSLMDTAYVGHLGSLPLAALGACTSIFHLAFNAFRATTSATTSLVVKCLPSTPTVGDDSTIVDANDASRIVTKTSLQLGLTMGLAVAAGLFLLGKRLLSAMGVDRSSPLFPYACQYLFCRCGAAPVVLFIQVCEGAFRGHGDTRIPLAASLTAALINLVMDPLLIFGFRMKVRGAALATAMAQAGAALVYAAKLRSRRMLPEANAQEKTVPRRQTSGTSKENNAESSESTTPSRNSVIRAILTANAALFVKQGSLLFGWAYATAQATRLGPDHVAAHQVGLSIWLVFALIMDSTSVAAQVLVSRAAVSPPRQRRQQVSRLLKFFGTAASVQGMVSWAVLGSLGWIVPIFTRSPAVRDHIYSLVPFLAAQQLLVSLTLVCESCAIGLSEYSVMAVGTAMATFASIWQLSLQQSIEGIWNIGIVTLFAGRFLSALVASSIGYYKLVTRHGKETKRD